MFGFWAWLRHKVKTSVLEGFADAVRELEQAPAAEEPAALSLAGLLRARLPAPAAATEAHAEEAAAVASGNGKRKKGGE